MLGSPAGPGGAPQRGLWPLAPAQTPSATSFSTDGLSKYGLYSLFPGTAAFGSALYSHASTIGRFASGHIQQSSGNTFHAAHKVSDSLFSATGYTFGASTPPPGSPYSPIPVAQLELLTKGYSNNIIIQQQPPDYPPSPKKIHIAEKRCDEKCCSIQQKSQKLCPCPSSQMKKIQELSISGCSRTNPIEWAGVNVKKEPGTPCQVAEISTSASPVVKLEVTSPIQKHGMEAMNLGGSMINSNGAQIPVGIAVARQRVQHELLGSPSLPPAGLLATVNASGAQIKEIDNAGTMASMASMAAGTSGAVPGGGGLLQCADDRSQGLAAWQVGGSHNQTLTTPTLWQYPEPLQQAVVWPSYHQPSSVLLPSLSSMQPPPLQLLSSASSDYLASSTTLHQHTQTHSTRLVAVTTDSKRKLPLPLPTTALIKIEADGSMDQTKLQTVSTIANNAGTVFTDQTVPSLVTTHVIYQHPTNLIVSQNPILSTEAASCRSQATSPVISSESVQLQDEEHLSSSTVQDASNQTDSPICSEDDNTTHALSDVIGEEKTKYTSEVVEPTPEEPPSGPFEPNRDEEMIARKLTEGANFPSAAHEEATGDKLAQQPDLSGLELLSNSIVEFERTIQSSEETQEASPVTAVEAPAPTESSSQVALDDALGGLEILCALAEQRIREENIEKPSRKHKRNRSRERHRERKREKRKSRKHSADEPKKKKLKGGKHRSRAERHKERELRRLEKRHFSERLEIEAEASQMGQCACQYKNYKTPESELEVKRFLESKTRPSYCCKGDWNCMNSIEMEMRLKLAELQREYQEKRKELSKLKPKKHSHRSDCLKRKSRKKSVQSERSTSPASKDNETPVPEIKAELLLKPSKLGEVHKRRHSPPDSSTENHSSSKKRKVGRPKRLMSTNEILGTETIVAKKLKSNFVGRLLAAKEKLTQQSDEKSADATPPRYVEEPYTHKLKKVKINTPVTEEAKSSKMRPTLKAEATVKVNDDDSHSIEDEDESFEDDAILDESFGESVLGAEDSEVRETNNNEKKVEASSGERVSNRCTLTDSHLEIDKLRVLTAMGGLFYAGHLNAIEPPDVYSITLDGERGNRPHIMSREEILRDAIVEISPKSTAELTAGTRLCAYWSQQYRCLYPGSAAEPGTPDPQLDAKFVSVEFDDGDSGRIALQDIRLLPPNYPVMEYDPNPLLSLSRRKRRMSSSVSTEEKQSSEPPVEDEAQTVLSTTSKERTSSESDHHKQKKRLKKKKKKKKHECAEEVCTHKKHKKHKKRRKHHGELDDEMRASQPLAERSMICTIIQDVRPNNEEEEEQEDQDEDEDQKEQEDQDDPEHEEDPGNEEEPKDQEEPENEEEQEEQEEQEEEEAQDAEEADEEHEREPQQDQVMRENDSLSSPMEEIIENDQFMASAIYAETSNIKGSPLIEADTSKDDIEEKSSSDSDSNSPRERQPSCESRSKMNAFLPAVQLWHWSGNCYKTSRAKGKAKKQFYKSIQRKKESISVGDAAVFLSTSKPDRPFIGKIESMFESSGSMVVRVKWYYHPEETIGGPTNLKYPGALFESNHFDENEVQTISHKCDVVSLAEFKERIGDDESAYESVYENNELYYLAGFYQASHRTIVMNRDIPFTN
ncbi:protein winged eye isoform X2 [Dendroctonus ponderosae]|uniref:protein winged eye isoform X2 n=1 Tax=Dendroctonus ponderosae TaxID=77166 RepID=UPI0020358E3A|nr:protein winged eye isoform X2 [Dendroctonus ponderosae]